MDNTLDWAEPQHNPVWNPPRRNFIADHPLLSALITTGFMAAAIHAIPLERTLKPQNSVQQPCRMPDSSTPNCRTFAME